MKRCLVSRGLGGGLVFKLNVAVEYMFRYLLHKTLIKFVTVLGMNYLILENKCRSDKWSFYL